MYGKYDLLLELDTLYHYFYGRDKVPGKLEPGNPNYELAYSTCGIVDYLVSLGEQAGETAPFARRSKRLMARSPPRKMHSPNACSPICGHAMTAPLSANP